jgi:hypothetical protein
MELTARGHRTAADGDAGAAGVITTRVADGYPLAPEVGRSLARTENPDGRRRHVALGRLGADADVDVCVNVVAVCVNVVVPDMLRSCAVSVTWPAVVELVTVAV